MYRLSRFNYVDGKPDEDQIEAWAESYYYSIMNIINAFFTQVQVSKVIESMKAIPFGKLAAEQLADESEEVIAIAVAKITELAESEMEILKAYMSK